MRNVVGNSDYETINRSLEKLFVLQDKSITGKKLTIIVGEIFKIGYPVDAVIKGIEALHDRVMQKLTFGIIKESIISNSQYRGANKVKCDWCRGSGMITMIDDHKRNWTYACICQNGDIHKDLKKWTGSVLQDGKTLYQHELLGEKKFNEISNERIKV